MDARINHKCPPTSDVTHSLCMVSEAFAKLSTARTLIRESSELMKNEWAWHRADCLFKLPEEYQENLTKALEFAHAAERDSFWTQNSLRKYGKTDE